MPLLQLRLALTKKQCRELSWHSHLFSSKPPRYVLGSDSCIACAFLHDPLRHPPQANLALWEFTGSLGDVALPEPTRQAMASFYTANAARIRVILSSVVSGAAVADSPGAAVLAPAASPSSIILGLPAYRRLEWRLAVSVASRMRPNTVAPVLTLRLDTSAPTTGSGSAPAATQTRPIEDGSAAVSCARSFGANDPASADALGSDSTSSVYFEADAAALHAAIASLELAQAEVKSANVRRMMRYLH